MSNTKRLDNTNPIIAELKTKTDTLKTEVEDINTMISDGSLADMIITDNSITSSKLDNELNNVFNAIKENLAPTNYEFKSYAYTTNTADNVYGVSKSEDNVYTASVTFEDTRTYSYFRFKFSDKASEAILKDSMDFTVSSDKDVSIQIGLIFNGNWSKGLYCKSDKIELKSGVAQTYNIDFGNTKFQEALTTYADQMLEVVLILKGQLAIQAPQLLQSFDSTMFFILFSLFAT